jgi:hypothetical protein
MSKASFDPCGDCFSRYSPADSNLVSSHVAYLQSEEWYERIRIAASFRAWELPQRLADVAQTAKGHGSTTSREVDLSSKTRGGAFYYSGNLMGSIRFGSDFLYHIYKTAGHNKFSRVNWMSEKTTFQARKA